MTLSQELKSGVRDRTAARIAAAVLVSALLFGGATRFDVLAPAIPLLFGCVALAVYSCASGRPRMGWLERLCWAGLIVLPLVQLVPLPPSIWRNLPGHGYAADILDAIGSNPYLPLSLTPSRTLSSAVAFIPALAVYAWARGLDERQRAMLLYVLIGFISLSAILGFFQMAGGEGSRLRFYAITNRDAAVGFFSNANHFGVVAALVAPLAVHLGLIRLRAGYGGSYTPLFIGCSMAALLLGAAALSLSRSALLAAAGAVIVIVLLILTQLQLRSRMKIVVALASGGAILGASVLVAKAPAIAAIEESRSIGEDGRLALVPTFVEIIRDTLPLGTGFGSFDPVYRAYETFKELDASYLNNAHNDLAQIIIEGGVPAILLLLAWLVLIVRRVLHSLTARADHASVMERLSYPIAATFGLCAFLAHSLVDYPLRGAAASSIFALLLALLVGRVASERDADRLPDKAMRSDGNSRNRRNATHG